MTRRTLFGRLLSALAAAPLVGRAVAPKKYLHGLWYQPIDPEPGVPGGPLTASAHQIRRNQALKRMPAEYQDWVNRWMDYKLHYPERVAAHDAELRRLFPILYADD